VHPLQVLVLVLALEHGDGELAVHDGRHVERVDAEVPAPLGEGVERVVVRHVEHGLHAQQHEGHGARLAGVDRLPEPKLDLPLEPIGEAANMLIDDADVDVHGASVAHPRGPRQDLHRTAALRRGARNRSNGCTFRAPHAPPLHPLAPSPRPRRLFG